MVGRELTLADYVAIAKRRWVLITVLAAIGTPLAYGVSRFLPTAYKSQTLVLVQPPTVSSKVVEPVDTLSVGERLATMQQQILSRTRLEPIIRQFGLYPQDTNRVSMDDLVGRLRKSVEVSPVEPMAETRANNLPGFSVQVTLDNPRTAQQVCTAITSMFIEESLRASQERSQVTTAFLSQQLDEAKKNLDAQDAQLAAFKGRHLGSLPDEEQTNLNLLTNLTSQLDAATQSLSRAQQDKSFAESNLTEQLAAWQASQSGRNPETLEQQLAALQTQLANLQSRYTDDYPDVIKTKHDIAALEKRIAQNNSQQSSGQPDKPKAIAEPAQVSQLRAQIHSYEQVIAEKTREEEKIKDAIKVYQDRVQSSPAVEEEYKELTRGYQTALDSYNDLLKKRDDAEMATALQQQQEGEQFSVLDPANLPDKPSFPNRPLFALGGLAGGLSLGLVLSVLVEMRDTSLRNERDVEFSLRLPVLALIPTIEAASTGKPKASSGAPGANMGLALGTKA
jgi:polysaccharide chain length determinant protein (PEP-CTERM system associated)